MIKKKKTDKEFLISWGITNPNFRMKHLRYQNPPEKGVYWYWFSLFVRQRDVEKWGTCISCGKPITVDTCDAGHYCPASSCGRDLLFDPLNVNAECGRCNAFDEGHLFGYERGLIERYGADTPNKLKERYANYRAGGPVRDFKGSEYADLIKLLPSYTQRCMQDDEQ